MSRVALSAIRAIAGMVGLIAAAGVASAGTLAEYKLLVLGGDVVKWGPPALGTGTIVTYRVATERTVFAAARNCSEIAPVDGLLSTSRVGRSLFDVELAAAFQAWADVADIAFVEADGQSPADILIGAQVVPRGRAFTNVMHAPPPEPEVPGRIVNSVICLNPVTPWKVGFDGDLDVYDLRYALMHEIGHAIGLDHPGVPGELMDFRYGEQFSSLQDGDRAGAISLYGRPGTTVSDSAGSTERHRTVRRAGDAFGSGERALQSACGADLSGRCREPLAR